MVSGHLQMRQGCAHLSIDGSGINNIAIQTYAYDFERHCNLLYSKPSCNGPSNLQYSIIKPFVKRILL